MKYKKLAAEMLVNDITKKDLAELLGKSVETINRKIKGKSDFSTQEVVVIMKTYFKNKSANYIFDIK